MNNFWQEQHKNKNEYWLSGTNNAEYILDLHKIDRNISNNKILDIGVGMGHLSRYLYSKKNTMFCSDISQIALDNLNDIASTYLTSDLSRIEPVDIAICNLVFQHCNDIEIQRILNDFSIQSYLFAFMENLKIVDQSKQPPDIKKDQIEVIKDTFNKQIDSVFKGDETLKTLVNNILNKAKEEEGPIDIDNIIHTYLVLILT
jgi:SAM-dependent methyltransferase